MLEGKKISELDQIDTLSLGSSFPVLDKGATKRIAFSALLNKIENELPESDIDKVKDDVEKLKVKTESINTLTTEMEAVKDQVSGVDEMVQGQNATIRNCVSTVEGLEQVIETTHFDDVLALEEQVRANTTNIEKKLNKTTDSANAGKAVVVDENGNLVFGAAGVQVSEAEGNAIEEKEDGIYVPLDLSGVPIGVYLSWGSDNIPAGFLECNGQGPLNRSDYPVLYTRVPPNCIIDENTFRVPDLRETSIVGVGENATLTIAAHDVYELGQFKDDQIQGHNHFLGDRNGARNTGLGAGTGTTSSYAAAANTGTRGIPLERATEVISDDNNGQPRTGTTTHGKQYGLRFIVKATDYTTVQEDVLDDSKATTGNVWSASKVKSEIENKHKYSTEEKVIGEWIDGKPIYRKVFTDPNNSWNTNDNIIGSITNFKEPISIKAVAFNELGLTGWVENNEAGDARCYAYVKSNGEVHFYRNEILDGVLYPKKVIIEYTKTTD